MKEVVSSLASISMAFEAAWHAYLPIGHSRPAEEEGRRRRKTEAGRERKEDT